MDHLLSCNQDLDRSIYSFSESSIKPPAIMTEQCDEVNRERVMSRTHIYKRNALEFTLELCLEIVYYQRAYIRFIQDAEQHVLAQAGSKNPIWNLNTFIDTKSI